MEANPKKTIKYITFLLMSLAYIACEVAMHLDGNLRLFSIAFGFLIFLLSFIVGHFIPKPAFDFKTQKWQANPSGKYTLALGSLLILPIIIEPLIRIFTSNGFPLDLQLVNSLRILGVLLCAFVDWPIYRKLIGVVALFLALFSSAMGDQPQIPFILIPFVLIGGLWLIMVYRFEQFNSLEAVSDTAIVRVPIRLPYRELIIFGTLAVLCVLAVWVGPRKVMVKLFELLPTSGGTGNVDPFARYGVGDGPEEVAGDQAKTAGMVETEKMIEDNRDALIDAVNDLYGEPKKPNQDQEKMVAAGLVEMIENHGRLPENMRPSRQFDTSRKGPKTNKKPESIEARAIIEVEGRTPLHIRLVSFHEYDENKFIWRETKKYNCLIEALENDWMSIGNVRDSEWYGEDESHLLKVAKMNINLVPTPTRLSKFRINKVNQSSYYFWIHDGVLGLAGRKKTPNGIVVSSLSKSFDLYTLKQEMFSSNCASELLSSPQSLNEIKQLAEEWTAGKEKGWPQIEAILSKLRNEYHHDNDRSAKQSIDDSLSTIEEAGKAAFGDQGLAKTADRDMKGAIQGDFHGNNSDQNQPAIEFLKKTKRGPDYLFATSACLMLRSLGYPARICLGYYANPDAFDPQTNHTPVKNSDLHFWPEVMLKDNHWIVLEPTPGYTTLERIIPLSEKLYHLVFSLLVLLKKHWIIICFLTISAVWAIWKKSMILDWMYTQFTVLFLGKKWNSMLINTAKLMDRRLSLAGISRSKSRSISDWLNECDIQNHGIIEFVKYVDWATYSQTTDPPIQENEIQRICCRTIKEWSVSKIKNIIKKRRNAV